jgi:dCTP deaminase
MPLSDKEILAARERGDIIIEPFDKHCLGTDSYDVRLGEFFYREHQNRDSTFDIFDALDVQCVWHPYCAERPLQEMPGIYFQDRVVLLDPGETILAHTQEFIGTRRNYTTKMFARSSAGRAMIGVCKCAGKGDVGFFNRWTMEITSFSRYHTIPLKVGMRIAQIEFLHVGETLRTYGVTHGKYQDGADLEAVKAAWRPEMMLPQFHKDWELDR